jgi:hypothetical protein
MFVEYVLDVGYKKIYVKEVNLKPKRNLSKEEDYEKNPNCKNCPYYIYRISCPYRRGKKTRLRNPIGQNPSKRKLNK